METQRRIQGLALFVSPLADNPGQAGAFDQTRLDAWVEASTLWLRESFGGRIINAEVGDGVDSLPQLSLNGEVDGCLYDLKNFSDRAGGQLGRQFRFQLIGHFRGDKINWQIGENGFKAVPAADFVRPDIAALALGQNQPG